jgi:hypothetical protein
MLNSHGSHVWLTIAAFILFVAGSESIGQTIPQDAPIVFTVDDGVGGRHPATCQDFDRQPDGSWSNNKPIWLDDYNISGRLRFDNRLVLNGMNITDLFEKTCAKF